MSEFKDLLIQLKQDQRQKILERKTVFVSDWGQEGFKVEINKIKIADLIEAERLATVRDEDGQKVINQEKKNIFLIIRSLEGFSLSELPLLEEYTPAGVIHSLMAEILEFSGFGKGLDEVIKDKKKV